MLPEAFLSRMQNMLGDDYNDFIQCFDRIAYQGLRINPLKLSTDPKQELPAYLKDQLSPIPWAKNGYFYQESDAFRPGKHPYHDAGLYYIQEPSAMSAAEYLEIKPGDYVLDLCAAPGGKSTQLACKMKGEGILFSNEIVPSRAKILSENIERLGIRNCIVTNEDPRHLAEMIPGFFDRILVDAPCSGEGMFRKNSDASSEWSPENVALCAQRQDMILDCAAKMLSDGGRIVYSTCTFAPEEDEGSISRFLERHPDFHIVKVKKAEGFSDGNPEFYPSAPEEIRDTIRLWPQNLKGEGHYIAVLEQEGKSQPHEERFSSSKLQKGSPLKKYPEAQAFFEANLQKEKIPFLSQDKKGLSIDQKYILLSFGEQLYLSPKGTPSLKRLKVVRPGLHLGTNKPKRFDPSHALALALSKEDVLHSFDLNPEEAESYRQGLTFQTEGEKGWYLLTLDGYSFAWGKLAGGSMKNHYPKGLRK
jgi:NOL1/NOP2/sun family putative RNA methylase